MTDTSDKAGTPFLPGSSNRVHEVHVTADMIASNVSPANRVAPSLRMISIIGDIYDFAERLRAGSTLGGKSGK
jgi:hypothetical protein